MKKTAKKNKQPVGRRTPAKTSTLRAIAATETEAGDASGSAAEETGVDSDTDDATPQARPKARPTATAAIVGAAFEAAVSRQLRRRLTHGQALAAIVVVPTTHWVMPAAAYVKSTYGSRWHLHIRDWKDKRDASVGSEEAARDLSQGLCVMGIAADAKLLPASLTAAADVTIRIAPPDGAVLRRAITRFARRSPGELEPGVAAGLDLHQLVAAFRPGKGPREIVRRLAAASKSGAGPLDRVPDLDAAIEYGAARTWGLDLARDVEAFRKGNLKFSELNHAICAYGPPGTGKTLFAKVLAAKLGAPLVNTSVPEWFASSPGYLDSVIKAFRSAITTATALASPISVLHLEEVDALPRRDTMSRHGREWWNTLIAEVLITIETTLAGFSPGPDGSPTRGVIVIGSTNFIEGVDPALLRPGRLEKAVEIKPPDAAGVANILRFHLDGEIQDDLSDIGAMMAGATGAEIMHAVKAARRIARHASRELELDDLRRVILPDEQHPPARLFRMAVHEAAHAVAALALSVGKVEHAVLRAEGASGGQTAVDWADDDLLTRRTIEDRVVVALAGRAAERLLTGEMSAGGASDIGLATAKIAELHASFGLGGDPVHLGAGKDLLGELALNPDLRERVGRDLRGLEKRAAKLVGANRAAVLAVAARLAEKRHLAGAEIEEIVRGRLVAPAGTGRRRPARKE